MEIDLETSRPRFKETKFSRPRFKEIPKYLGRTRKEALGWDQCF